MSILVTEDDEDIRSLVVLLLEEEGYQTEAAENGLEALDLIKQKKPDLILLDMKMPVMNGWEFAAAYRKLYGHEVPIIVMTAAEHPARRASEIGAEGWLSKPFSQQELLDKVKKHLQQKNENG